MIIFSIIVFSSWPEKYIFDGVASSCCGPFYVIQVNSPAELTSTMATQQVESEKQSSDIPQPLSKTAAISEPGRAASEVDNAKDETAITDDYAHGPRLAALVISLMLGMFLVALDNVGPMLADTLQS